MIYTIGYQNMTLHQLEAVVIEKGIDLIVDVRSIPYSRKHEFNRRKLEALFGSRYIWKGQELGGRNEQPITAGAIKWVVQQGDKKILLLMCMEEDPAQCHRHQEIARRITGEHNVDVIHITPSGDIQSRDVQGGRQCRLL